VLRGWAAVKRRSGQKVKMKVTARSPVRRRSASAAALAAAGYRQRVLKSAKIYRRKGRSPLGREADE
jgi:hypothetical protein